MSSKGRAIIVGAGIAGLATAIRLAVQGWQVQVFEINSYPGGKLSWFEQDGYAFDAGPSLFTQPQYIEDLFALANEPIQDYFQYVQSDVACRYFFANGKQVTAWADHSKFAAEMETQLGEPAANVHAYLQRSATTYNKIGKLFVEKSLRHWRQFSWKEVATAIKHSSKSLLMSSLNAYNEQAFTTKEAVQMFNRYATYNGSNPYKAPGMLSLIPHLELNVGTFYPKGGMISITNALHRLAEKKGVQFHFNSKVDRIIESAGKAEGVVVNGRNIMADLIVSNADVYFTYKHLLRNELAAKKVLKQERSSSALIFYWGIKTSFPQLGLHNIFFSDNYAEEFRHLFQTKSFYPDPTVYINITTKMESGQAPEGKENWFVMINAPANVGQPWSEWIPEARQRIISKLSAQLQCDVEALIETEAVLDPVTIEQRTASYMGSLYGTSSNSRMAAFLRHANDSAQIQGLYFVGGSVHPGGGIPLCMQSAAITVNLIQKQYKLKHVAHH
ncbi:1-hydroxycarotenoid 3,4-desaturase CrtD [Phnomibacter ginsenosidimutans]|uniref:Phytoene desaturase n=1 Tax=Phnomibacter ginsenosidimutans TaxID=2676868 RepID=A0A6I6GWK9_9BACT|nr:1-hydroxycarotenoid 3,4-desaturase CrtD [Phnomibacter ginsenosidimutans]QGW27041.1 phytoene desaturase [Phnomibacter ginsenosidimutans]